MKHRSNKKEMKRVYQNNVVVLSVARRNIKPFQRAVLVQSLLPAVASFTGTAQQAPCAHTGSIHVYSVHLFGGNGTRIRLFFLEEVYVLVIYVL